MWNHMPNRPSCQFRTREMLYYTSLISSVIFVCLYSKPASGDQATEDYEVDDGGWWTDPTTVIARRGPCNIEVRDASQMSQFEFLERYAYDAPVVIKLSSNNNNNLFRKLSRRVNMLSKYGKNVIRLSTANTHSYEKVDVPLNRYVDEFLRPQRIESLGNETYYWFGDNNHTEWAELFDSYVPPPYSLPGKTGAYSYGVAAAGTGVPFHFHGPGFSEVIYGSKRWFLYPSSQMPTFHPNETALQWLTSDYVKLHETSLPFECTIEPGEAIYFPDRWWHSTLNINTSVFMSTFLG